MRRNAINPSIPCLCVLIVVAFIGVSGQAAARKVANPQLITPSMTIHRWPASVKRRF